MPEVLYIITKVKKGGIETTVIYTNDPPEVVAEKKQKAFKE